MRDLEPLDLGRVRVGDVLSAASGLVLALSTFLPWYQVEIFEQTYRVNAWTVGTLWALPLLVVGFTVLPVVVLTRVGTQRLDLVPGGWGNAWLLAGLGALVLVATRASLDEPGFDRGLGMPVAALGAAGLALGGHLITRSER